MLEFYTPYRSYDVYLDEFRAGGAFVEFVGMTPPLSSVGIQADFFLDLGPDGDGYRVAGTLQAEILYFQQSARGATRAFLLWTSLHPETALTIGRLLAQQYICEHLLVEQIAA